MAQGQPLDGLSRHALPDGKQDGHRGAPPFYATQRCAETAPFKCAKSFLCTDSVRGISPVIRELCQCAEKYRYFFWHDFCSILRQKYPRIESQRKSGDKYIGSTAGELSVSNRS